MKKRFIKSLILFIILTCALFLVACKNNTYVVVFDYNYSDMFFSQEVKNGETAVMPSTPTRNKYEFIGWYSDKDLTKKYDENTKITSNTTIYAKWEAIITYIIKYNLNGGTVSDVLIDEFVEASEVTLPTPTKANYEFDGWYENGVKIEEIENRNYFLDAKYTPLYKTVSALSISPIRDEIEIYTDIIYKNVGGEELKMDIYLPPSDGSKLLPVLFMYYGGGFIMGDKSQVASSSGDGFIQNIFDYVLNNNVAIVIPNYRLANGNTITFPWPVEDAIDAIRFCVKNSGALGIDVNNIGTLGYSAGAYMALMAAYAQTSFSGDPDLKSVIYYVKYVVDMYGPSYYDATEIGKLSLVSKIMLSSFLGSGNYSNEDEFAYTMPSYYVNESSPETYIVHGMADSLVPYSQSEKLYALLQKNKVNSSLLLVEGATHTLTLASGYDKTSKSIKEIYEDIEKFIINCVNK